MHPASIEPNHFAQLFTTHGSIMIFFMAMPFLTGLINYIVPLQIGARETWRSHTLIPSGSGLP